MNKALFFLFILLTSHVFAQKGTVSKPLAKTSWLKTFDFNPSVFKDPPLQYGPFTRWWWPGNFVEQAELKREINLFADNRFGGVEIQPMNLFIPGSSEVRAKVNSWDTPDYYANVIAVMQEARKKGLTVDMTDGSGWPPGGPHLKLEDGFQTLSFAAVDVAGKGHISIPVPKVDAIGGVQPKLQAVVAYRFLPNPSVDKSSTVKLDSSSATMLTQAVKHDSISWEAPAGNWKVIAFWSKPQGQKTMSASPTSGIVMDHFDSTKVLKSYKYLFGARTGLQPYFGNPMRAVFDDSYEFAVDRHYAVTFPAYFKKHRGYDITPWLPAEMQKGYNYVAFMRPSAKLDFSFSDQDWRLKYDYDLTLSEMLTEQFLDATKTWLEPQGLLHRTQAYGLNLDMIAAAGHASIPETESMLGPEVNVKIMTSGGHLYNKPIISAESVVFSGKAYTNTPQKIKIAVDKLFATGVNQVIYHGVPYRYKPTELGPEGWYPFSTPMLAMVNFSSNLGEGNIFWKDQKEVNDYIARTQYVLRSGKPHSDVLIYFPFMDVDGVPENPEEIMAKGYLKDADAPEPLPKEIKNEGKEKWAAKVYSLINQLEANGITWEWVNDESIQNASLAADKSIDISGNRYQALILAEDSLIQLKTANKIQLLAKGGLRLAGTGTLPTQQPSYLNWKENDKKTARLIKTAFAAKRSKYSNDVNELIKWLGILPRLVNFNGEFHFTRQVQRDMNDGSRVQFIWNKTDQWQTLKLLIDKKYKSSYWLNADGGTVIKNDQSFISYRMAPYGSVILYASTKRGQFAKLNQSLRTVTDLCRTVKQLPKWNLNADSVELKDSPLFDWRKNTRLQFSSAEGIYTTSFNWSQSNFNGKYYLDLGKVYYTAEVYINGKYAGKRIYAPYTLDITSLLKSGQNSIEVRVTTGQLNGFIGGADKGAPHYKQFKSKGDQLMAAGIIGPIVIRNMK